MTLQPPTPPPTLKDRLDKIGGLLTAVRVITTIVGAYIVTSSGAVKATYDFFFTPNPVIQQVSAMNERLGVVEGAQKEWLKTTTAEASAAAVMVKDLQIRIDEAKQAGEDFDELEKRLRDVENKLSALHHSDQLHHGAPTQMSPKLLFIGGGMLIAVAVVGAGFYDAAVSIEIYSKVNGYSIKRKRDFDGNDRVYITASTTKLQDCDLESGEGPPWLAFFDDDGRSVTPTGGLYRPDGSPSGNTRGDKGAKLQMDGYSTIVPNMLSKSGGTFILQIPCQLWKKDPKTGDKVFREQALGSRRPVPIPMPGAFSTQAPVKTASE